MDKDWKKYGFTEDGQFACDLCKGTKKVKMGKHDEFTCPRCLGSGYMVDAIKGDVGFEQATVSDLRKTLLNLQLWVKTTSKCSLCNGNTHKTLGGCPCPECTLEGTAPWGG